METNEIDELGKCITRVGCGIMILPILVAIIILIILTILS